jgi:TPR repeat protein
MRKRQFPAWGALSSWAKLWLLCVLLSPLALAFVLRVLPPLAQEWLLDIVTLFCLYLLLRWVFNRRGLGWLWRFDLFCRKLIAIFSPDKGRLWLRWARNTDNDRMASAMAELSASCGNPEGLYEWGLVCRAERREESAMQAFWDAARLGHIEASWEVGEAARWGIYMPRDRALARKWHEHAARNGHVPSIRILATALETGDGLDADIDAAQRWQKRLQALIAQIESENGLSQNKDLAMQAWEKEQSGPFLESIRFIGQFANAVASRVSFGIVRTVTPPLFWGSFIALALLATYLVITNFFAAIAAIVTLPTLIWYWAHSYRPSRELMKLEKRAKAGEAAAMYELGMMYRNGSVHFPQDVPEAWPWLLKAAEAGHPEAMLQIGQLMAWGYGGPKDAAQGRQWLQRAKSLGLSEADTHLGRMAEGS